MLDKLTSVSPPQKADLLIKNQKSGKLEDLGAKNLKSDFKDQFKDQLKEQLKKEQAKDDQKDFKAEKKETQPGENKKKVAKKDDHESDNLDNEDRKLDKSFDPTMILMNMVSDESEIKIPDFEENLAQVEESEINLTKNIQAGVLEIKPQAELFGSSQMQDAAVVDQSLPELLPVQKEQTADVVQPEVEVDISLQPAPLNPFQEKVMAELKKSQPEALDLKSEINLSQVVQESKVDLSAQAQSDSKHDSSGDSSNESKSLKPDSIKNELLKTDSNHFGQSEFHTQLSTHGAETSKSSEAVSKTETLQSNDPGVKDLLSQANYLVTKGGGEVTLKMNGADGMGDVHLKVIMDQGRMNIELNTQDKSVKKLIEDSLSDLRSSLAARQISLEHVKINSVNAANTENNSQSMQNNHHQSGSESNQSKTFDQLQQQMQQQKNQHQQRQFVKTALNEDRPVVIPLKSVQRSAASQYYGLNKAQGLNAVA